MLYRLPEVVNSDEVMIVEGEKDADNLGGSPVSLQPHAAAVPVNGTWEKGNTTKRCGESESS